MKTQDQDRPIFLPGEIHLISVILGYFAVVFFFFNIQQKMILFTLQWCYEVKNNV